MASKHIFVTVGTTKFDPLISTILRPQTLRVFRSRGYGSVSVQVGNGDVELVSGTVEGINISCFRFLPSIANEINNADLVISHAGAGTCLEVLNAQKPLIAVVNSDLMDDHQAICVNFSQVNTQVELAKKLSDDGHIIFSEGPEKLAVVFQNSDFTKLTPFPPGQPQKFAEFLDNFMGFKVSTR
ncbi:hypothetical protein J437_LFUL009636 [Ladona fulva]|uniref:UDP-N-acetylglucosamine transferase subunit ALG13 n=1 Tax=Ladona fulva TaxID=123851 RepID=A0A8K0K8Q9_LADFU|nr:hypothetical protein J437_LFUL009636 [Ladona fulva]